jgi:hypothetical protein
MAEMEIAVRARRESENGWRHLSLLLVMAGQKRKARLALSLPAIHRLKTPL